jgi:hypothetical protein
MILEAFWDWVENADLPTLLLGLGFVAFVLYIAYELVNWFIKRISHDPTTPQRWWGGCWRVVRLLGPGVLFWIWCPYHLFTASNELSGERAVSLLFAWLAWPILCYAIGREDGKREMQPKLDALYDALHEESARKRGEPA